MMSKRKINKSAGFTLLELLIALVMLAILAGIAAPSFTDYLATNGVFSHRQDINAAVMMARSEALNRNKTITICPSLNSTNCSGTWSNGWLVFIDDGEGAGTPRDGLLSGSEQIISAYDYTGKNSITVVDADSSSALNYLSFNEQGRPAEAGVPSSRRVLITICDSKNTASLARGLLLIGSGRLIRTRDNNNDGVHESRFADGDGSIDVNNNLSCS